MSAAGERARERFEASLSVLEEFVAIPALSPAFDPDWEATGALAGALELVWAFLTDALPAAEVEIVTLAGRTPVLLADVPATPAGAGRGTTLVYGHLDKQPAFGTWREGLEAFKAVREGDRLYGRGAADDGYAAFAAGAAIGALRDTGADHGRVVVLLEASEESGSPDLEAYLDHLAARLGDLALVICLDSGAVTYDRLWVTTSLRGVLMATLRIKVLDYGVHSGLAGGVVPSSFRLARELLSRIEDEKTGEILLPHANVVVPEHRHREIVALAELVGDALAEELPSVPGLRLEGASAVDRIERATWGPSLAVTGAAGLPSLESAGNVLRPETALRLSMRLPPSADGAAAAEELRGALLADPPSGAQVTFELEPPGAGWDAPALAPWLADATTAASTAYFGAPPGAAGTGGSIPFLASLGARHPQAQFLATGVLGPGANAHGPDESLHVPSAIAISAVIADVLAAVPERPSTIL